MKKYLKQDIWICSCCHRANDGDDDNFECECGNIVCEQCWVACGYCERPACKKCMVYDPISEKHFCNTSTKLGERKLEKSECLQEWIKEEENADNKTNA